MEFEIDATFDFDGYTDYYRGHGHTFRKERLVACIPFSIPITYRETVSEVIIMVLEDINGTIEPIEFLTEDKEVQECIRKYLTDECIEKCLRDALIEGTKDSDKFFDIDKDALLSEEEGNEIMEYPQLIGYIHVYRKSDFNENNV